MQCVVGVGQKPSWARKIVPPPFAAEPQNHSQGPVFTLVSITALLKRRPSNPRQLALHLFANYVVQGDLLWLVINEPAELQRF